jgi:hypothetical protein
MEKLSFFMQEASRMKEMAVNVNAMTGKVLFRDGLITPDFFNIFGLSQRYEKYSITG